MDTYLLVKLLHIVAAMTWFGGGICLLILGILAERSRDGEEMMRVMGYVALLGNTLFAPAALVTLAAGLLMVYMAWSFTELWILLALAGFAMSFAIGTGVLKPRSDRLALLAAKEGPSPAVMAQGRELLRAAKFDYAVIISILVLMVLKPSAQDHATLGLLAALLVFSAVLFLAPRNRAAHASA